MKLFYGYLRKVVWFSPNRRFFNEIDAQVGTLSKDDDDGGSENVAKKRNFEFFQT